MTWEHYLEGETVHLVASNQDTETLCEIPFAGAAVPVAEGEHPLEASSVCTLCRVAYAEQEYADGSITVEGLAEGDAIAYWFGDPFDPTAYAELQTGVIEETPPYTAVDDVRETENYLVKRGPKTKEEVKLEWIYETGLDPDAVVEPDDGGEIADTINEAVRKHGRE
jgi:hypothetical protein